jgi:hypothetical protein
MEMTVADRAEKVARRLRVCAIVIGIFGFLGSAVFSFTVSDGSSGVIGGGGFPEFALCLVLVAVLVLQAFASLLDLLRTGSTSRRL